MLVGIQVMNWLEWIKLFIFHFVPSNPSSGSPELDAPELDAPCPTLKANTASREPRRQGIIT
jgi:hypothetical protein